MCLQNISLSFILSLGNSTQSIEMQNIPKPSSFLENHPPYIQPSPQAYHAGFLQNDNGRKATKPQQLPNASPKERIDVARRQKKRSSHNSR